MKYFATFVVGVGLMANGPAVSDTLRFPEFLAAYGTDLSVCLTAQKNGIELMRETKTELKGSGQLLESRVFVSRQDDVYVMSYLEAELDESGEWHIGCFETVPK